MGLIPIRPIPSRPRLSRLERAERTIADAQESYVSGDLDLDELERVVEDAYRDALRIPKTMEQLAEEMRARVAREEGTVVNGETRSERIARLCEQRLPIVRYPGRPEFDGLSLAEASRLAVEPDRIRVVRTFQ